MMKYHYSIDNISNNNWLILLPYPPVHPFPHPSRTGSQCDKVYLQSKGRMPTANWPLQSFSYFYLVIVLLPVNMVNLVIRALEYAKRGDRQFSMFMSENIYTMVDLFDKAVAGGGGARNHCGTRSEGDDET